MPQAHSTNGQSSKAAVKATCGKKPDGGGGSPSGLPCGDVPGAKPAVQHVTPPIVRK